MTWGKALTVCTFVGLTTLYPEDTFAQPAQPVIYNHVPIQWQGSSAAWSGDVSPRNRIDDTIDQLIASGSSAPIDINVNFRRCVDSTLRNQLTSAVNGKPSSSLQRVSSYTVSGVTPSEAQAVAALNDVAFVERTPGFSVESDVSMQSLQVIQGSAYSQYVRERCPTGPGGMFPTLDGTGATVAVIDTGAKFAHPGLSGISPVALYDAVDGGVVTDKLQFPDLASSHGTGVAWLAAGRQFNSTFGGPECLPGGVAPGAGLVVVRALSGDGSNDFLPVIRGLEQIYAHPEWGVDVINMSLRACDVIDGDVVTRPSNGLDSFSELVNLGSSLGMVMVAAVGNDGIEDLPMGSPAAAARSIAVGATNTQRTPERTDDTIDPMSTRGPREPDDDSDEIGEQKPEVVAPHRVWTAHGTFPGGQQAQEGAGTSFAAPQVAGLVALIKQARPGLDPASIKDLIIRTSEQHADGGVQGDWDREWGYGMINVYKALAEAALADLTFPGIATNRWNSPDITVDTAPVEGVANVIRAMVRNNGPADALRVRVVFAASALSATVIHFDEIGTKLVDIPAGQMREVALDWVPSVSKNLSFRVQIVYGVDTNPSNNSAFRSVTVLAATPGDPTDLTFQSTPGVPRIRLDQVPAAGSPNWIRTTLQNLGPASASGVQVEFLVHSNTQAGQFFRTIGTQTVSSIAPNTVVQVAQRWIPETANSVTLQAHIVYGPDSNGLNNYAYASSESAAGSGMSTPFMSAAAPSNASALASLAAGPPLATATFEVANTVQLAPTAINIVGAFADAQASADGWSVSLNPPSLTLAGTDCPVPVTVQVTAPTCIPIGRPSNTVVNVSAVTASGGVTLGGLTLPVSTSLPTCPGGGGPLSLQGSDALSAMFNEVIALCPGAATQLGFVGGGSSAGESAMLNDQQEIAPLSRFLQASACAAGPASAGGCYPLALDALSLVATDTASENCRAMRWSGSMSLPSGGTYTFQDWRTVLRIIYGGQAGQPASLVNGDPCSSLPPVRSPIAEKNCASEVRTTLVNTWGNMFALGDGSSCTNGACTALKHALRPDDVSATTETFLSLLALPNIGTGANAPFCNGTETQDNDPIRRACDGIGFANGEQVCKPVRTTTPTATTQGLGVVLPVLIPQPNVNPPYVSANGVLPFCSPNAVGGAFYGDVQMPFGTTQCPYGGTPNPTCKWPKRPPAQGGGFDCLAMRNDVPAGVSATTFDGRSFNTILRNAAGVIQSYQRRNATTGAIQTLPMTSAYYRIHQTRAITGSTLPANTGCAHADGTQQLGCLAEASPCSIALAPLAAVQDSTGIPDPNRQALGVRSMVPSSNAAVFPTLSDVRLSFAACQATPALDGGFEDRYPLARTHYLCTVDGIGNFASGWHSSGMQTAAQLDAQYRFVQCVQDRAVLDQAVLAAGLITLPPATPVGFVSCDALGL